MVLITTYNKLRTYWDIKRKRIGLYADGKKSTGLCDKYSTINLQRRCVGRLSGKLLVGQRSNNFRNFFGCIDQLQVDGAMLRKSVKKVVQFEEAADTFNVLLVVASVRQLHCARKILLIFAWRKW